MSAPAITVIGSSNTDMIIKVEHIPRPGETVLGGQFHTAGGGKGANQAVAAARAGGHVTLVARVGRDVFGDQAIRSYVKEGLQVLHVTRDARAPSGTALIFVARDGANCIGVASGANSRLAPMHVNAARSAIRKAQVVLTQLETPIPTVVTGVRLAARSGAAVILNPAPARNLPKGLLSLVSFLTPNESEAELLTGVRVIGVASARKAARDLLRRGVRTVIVTLGARGALVAQESVSKLIGGFAVKAVDTTAAGDVFNGALAVALAERQKLDEAVRFANAAAAYSVTCIGAQPSAPTRQQIERVLSSH